MKPSARSRVRLQRLAASLRKRMRAVDMTSLDLAGACNRSPAAISGYLNGRPIPEEMIITIEGVIKIAELRKSKEESEQLSQRHYAVLGRLLLEVQE